MSKKPTTLVTCIALLLLGSMWGQTQSQVPFDLVLQGGRVIDPETGLDGIRNVGIRGDRVVEGCPLTHLTAVKWSTSLVWWWLRVSSTSMRTVSQTRRTSSKRMTA